MDIIYLGPDEQPEGDKWILVEWKPGAGMVTNFDLGKTIFRVPEHLWDYWLEEGPAHAARIGLDRVYYRKKPPHA